jgi:ribosome assembly protein YihI (activator of Der GTPase)
MVKVYAIDAGRMNDQLIKYCLELNLSELDTLVKELELGYKVSHDQAARYCKIVDRCEALMYSAGLHEQKTQKTREVELL